ncbi:unnamed protein product [Caenorhabditis bovis]|uniref:Alpha-2-macroglobulin domain-containing protein n=1 Tax=Caenorhabditis bovis TaxID=2654633 RepID=A0A8S1EGA9_9PELO|nr:unnamed protein product [Caenorhabditis bovis]
MKAPKFNIIAARPYITKYSEQLVFMIDGDGISEGNITFKTKCYTKEKKNEPFRLDNKGIIGGIVEIEVPREWRIKCSVLKVEAVREIVNGVSRPHTVYIPNVNNSTLGSFSILVESPKPFYKVGDTLSVSILATDRKDMNYLVVCNSQTVTQIKKIGSNKKLQIGLTDAMKGTCLLFVFATTPKIASDMLLFRVRDDCQETTTIAKIVNDMRYELSDEDSTVEPGDDLEIEFKGQPRGLVFYRGMDDRLNQLSTKSDYFTSMLLDYSIFGDFHSGQLHASVSNLINPIELEKTIETECKKVGRLLKLNCPQRPTSYTSIVFQMCYKYIDKACNSFPELTAVAICNRKGACPAAEVSNKRLVVASSTREFNDPGIVKPPIHIRDHFQEVWLFDVEELGLDGTKLLKSSIPDNIGGWSLTSAYWSQGKVETCPSKTLHFQAKKNIFMNVEMPKNVYVNETVSVKITVTGLNIRKLNKFSICMTDVPRKVCADEGLDGKRGLPAYTNIALDAENTVQSKTFAMRFLVTGIANITMTLREESAFPGKHHCQVGKILDVVRLQLIINKRAETVKYYKRVMLNPGKPVLNLAMNDEGTSENTQEPLQAIETLESRSEDDVDILTTRISSNIRDTETIYSFSIDLSKFLPIKDYVDSDAWINGNRVRRNSNRFLSDVIKQLSIVLYRFKTISKKSSKLYDLESQISSLISEMLTFSDCKGNKETCGYYEYSRPSNPEERDIFLTSIVTSLLCEASVDESLVIGPLRTIIEAIQHFDGENIDLHDIVEMESPYDKKYLLASVMFQVSRDCQEYKEKLPPNVKYSTFGKLHRTYYSIDETAVEDDRTVAAIAFMASNVTQELMRIRMLERVDSHAEPYWSAGKMSNKIYPTKSNFDILSKKRRKSGDIMVNSLGLLAFLTAGADAQNIKWESLVDWIYRQQNEDGSFESPLDTYFASRALYEYRTKKVDIETNENVQIPTHVKNVTLEAKGRGKAVAEIRIIATKRQRLRRGLTQDDYYPVKITCEQQDIKKTFIQQTVCINALSPVIRTLEITHGLFTGFTSSPDKLTLLENSTEVTVLNPTKSSFAMHFILINLPHKRPVCYNMILSSPNYNNEPAFLAPVAIQTRHPISELVGMLLIAHPDVRGKSKRSIRIHRHRRHQTRFVRAITDESSVDTVCFDGGLCSCAETTCEVKCGKCAFDDEDAIREYISYGDNFGVAVRVNTISNMTVQGSEYTIYETTVIYTKGRGGVMLENNPLRILLRLCNNKCVHSNVSKGETFLLLGHLDGLTLDSNGVQNYVLRGLDRFEEQTQECKALNSAITLR